MRPHCRNATQRMPLLLVSDYSTKVVEIDTIGGFGLFHLVPYLDYNEDLSDS
jgi:hypothetical protein